MKTGVWFLQKVVLNKGRIMARSILFSMLMVEAVPLVELYTSYVTSNGG